MTALSKYQRLEASALWRDSISGQRRDVIVSLGDASLVITDKNERPLTHWSLAAVQRANPGAMPAVFHPDGDPCLLYTSPSPRDVEESRMPSSA